MTRGDSPKPKTFRHDYATYKNVCREMDWVPKCDCHKETKEGIVAFSAYQSAAKNYKAYETWIFDTVLVIDGNSYDESRGIFTAPSEGTYVFTWATLTDPNKMTHPFLWVNGQFKGYAAFNNSITSQKFWSSGSNTVLVRLKKGDKVNIASGYRATYAREKYTSFSGWKMH
ncbi:C1q-related factor-like [Saccostrea cucullata]|uniref:C1q-related factor-like n=1 Tax=Saccostrea cuccullata TaxID=36930 RepID=UPI002ED4D813